MCKKREKKLKKDARAYLKDTLSIKFRSDKAEELVQLPKILRFYRMVEQFLQTHVNTIFCFE